MSPAHEFSEDEVRHIALLGRLELTDDEVHRFAREFGDILGYVEQLRELDTEGIAPTSHAVARTNVFREDAPRPSLTNAQALANAPEAEDGYFRVPPIIQEE